MIYEIMNCEDFRENKTSFIVGLELADEFVSDVYDSDEEDAEAMILKKVTEDGEDSYELIEDDDEFNKVADLFAEQSEEYDVQIEE